MRSLAVLPLALLSLAVGAGCARAARVEQRPVTWTRTSILRNPNTYGIATHVDATLQSPEQRVGPIRIRLRMTTYADAPHNVWRLVLSGDDGREVPPDSIVHQGDVFVVSFPRFETRVVRLRMQSPRGELDFNW